MHAPFQAPESPRKAVSTRVSSIVLGSSVKGELNNCQKRRVLKRSGCREVITAYSSSNAGDFLRHKCSLEARRDQTCEKKAEIGDPPTCIVTNWHCRTTASDRTH